MKRCYSCFKEYGENFDVCPYCGTVYNPKPIEPIQLIPGTLLANRYIIGMAVGSGGFGIVYKAWDSKLETVVAVKEFFVSRLMTRAEGLKNVIVNKKSQTEYEYRKERFLAEARNMAKFGAHRSIPNVFEFFEENNTAYIVMELLQGIALNEYIAQNGRNNDIDFALMVANEVGNALKSLHENNIIHRDVAPDNVFICSGKDIRIKLMDLGAAKLADSTDEVIDIILKPGYSPTEQYDNSKNIGPWTDIYALGATLYMMVTGIKPDESTNRKINDTVLPPNVINPDVSENLSNTIMKAMAVEKHLRFKSIDEFLSAINGERKIIPLAKEKRRRKFRRFSGILAACIAIAIITTIVGSTFRTKKAEQDLKEATISVWFSVPEGSSEEETMKLVIEDFKTKFKKVTVDYKAIPESEYKQTLMEAAEKNSLPNLFESTGLPTEVTDKAIDLDKVIKSPQYKECLFLDQYNDYYSTKKKVPLGIEVPVAYVITSGNTSIDYSQNYFNNLADFGEQANVSTDNRYADLISQNFNISGLSKKESFLDSEKNTSAVLLSSSMIINEVRELKYDKKYVYCDSPSLKCKFTYEWSIGKGNEDEQKASEMLLSWMLGNDYQRKLMVNSGSTKQIPEIPVNKECFETKAKYLKNLNPILDIYKHFVFDKED